MQASGSRHSSPNLRIRRVSTASYPQRLGIRIGDRGRERHLGNDRPRLGESLARPSGSLNLRFIVQPTIAALLALRAGIEDAKQGRQGYLWALASNPERRLQLLHEGWRGARAPFLVAVVLDCIYQLLAFRFIYPVELLFTATLLALVPYALLRGPFNRLARLFFANSGREEPRMELEQRRDASMSNEAKPQDWSKPAAMAIPKGGFFPTRSSKGGSDPSSLRRLRLRLFDRRQGYSWPRGSFLQIREGHRENGGRAAETASPFCSFITFDGFCFRSRERPTSCIKASSTLTSTNIPKTR